MAVAHFSMQGFLAHWIAPVGIHINDGRASRTGFSTRSIVSNVSPKKTNQPRFHDLLHICVDFNIYVDYVRIMNAQELKKWLAAQGCTFEAKKGGSGHLVVIKDGKKTDLPMHGSRKELGTGLVSAIKKQLGLK